MPAQYTARQMVLIEWTVSSPGICDAIVRLLEAANRRTVHSIRTFEAACVDLDIEHRLTKPRHARTNGHVERMNRTIKDATVKRFHCDNHEQLFLHLGDFIDAYNFGRSLNMLKGITPYEFMCKR